MSSAGSSLGTGGMSTKIVAAQLATAAGVTTVITRSSSPGNVLKIVRYMQALKSSTATATPSASGQTTPHLPTTIGGGDGTTEDHHHPLSRSTASLTLDDPTPITPIHTTTTTTTTPAKPPLHTRFLPLDHPIRDRYFWLLHGLAPRGTIYIDQGAHAALASKAGLLPVGVLDVEGHFAQHEAVRICVVDRPPPGSDAHPAGRLWEGEPQEVGRALVNFAAPEIARIKGRKSSQIGALLGYADTEYVAYRENITLFRGNANGNGNGSASTSASASVSLRGESRPASPTPPVMENGGVAGYVVGSTKG